MLSYVPCFISVLVWTEEDDSNTLRVDAYFLKTEKKNLRFKNIRILVDGALVPVNWFLGAQIMHINEIKF